MAAMADAALDAEAFGFDLDDPRTLTRVLAVRKGTQALLANWNETGADAERKALAVVRGLIREGLI